MPRQLHRSRLFPPNLSFLILLFFAYTASAQTNLFDQNSGANTYVGGFGNGNWVNSWSGFLPTAGTQLFASANGNTSPFPNIGLTKNLGGVIANQTYNVSLNIGYYYANPITFPDFHQLYIGSSNGTMTWTSTPVPAVVDVWYTWSGTFTPAAADIGQPFTFHKFMDLPGQHSFVMDLNFDFTLAMELDQLHVHPMGSNAQIAWTLHEPQLSGTFEIERSDDGKIFQRMGEVAASGLSHYTFQDPNAMFADAHTLYYRLRFTDSDGAVETSQVVSLKLSDSPESIISAYIDRNNALLHLVNVRDLRQLQVVDLRGVRIWEKQYGDGATLAPIAISTWPTGIYLIHVLTREKAEVLKVQIVR